MATHDRLGLQRKGGGGGALAKIQTIIRRYGELTQLLEYILGDK